MDLETIKDTIKRPKKLLTGVHFDNEGAHVAICTGNGAASLMNEPYLLKSVEHSEKVLDKDDKTLGTEVLSTKPEIKKEENSKMDEVAIKAMQDELATLKADKEALAKELKKSEVTTSLIIYKLSDDIEKALADVMVDVPDPKPILDAMDEVATKVQAETEKAEKEDENPLKKALDDELGETDADTEELSLIDKIKKAQNESK